MSTKEYRIIVPDKTKVVIEDDSSASQLRIKTVQKSTKEDYFQITSKSTREGLEHAVLAELVSIVIQMLNMPTTITFTILSLLTVFL